MNHESTRLAVRFAQHPSTEWVEPAMQPWQDGRDSSRLTPQPPLVMPKLILGLTGMIGSGKGLIGDYLQKNYGAEFFKFSTYLSRALDVMGLEQSRENMIKISEGLRHAFGEDALSYAVARDAMKSTAQLAVIDGLRRPQDLVGLTPLPHFKLAAVEADQKIRYDRITNRGEKAEEHSMTMEDFLKQEQRATEVTVPETMKLATLTITNNGTQEELEKQLDELMAQFTISKV